jgi:hypothetical protein
MIRRLAMASGALGQRFSPHAAIDTATVAGLVPATTGHEHWCYTEAR